MIPQGQYVLIQQFLDSCTHLTADVKLKISANCEQIQLDHTERTKLEVEEKLSPPIPSQQNTEETLIDGTGKVSLT